MHYRVICSKSASQEHEAPADSLHFDFLRKSDAKKMFDAMLVSITASDTNAKFIALWKAPDMYDEFPKWSLVDEAHQTTPDLA